MNPIIFNLEPTLNYILRIEKDEETVERLEILHPVCIGQRLEVENYFPGWDKTCEMYSFWVEGQKYGLKCDNWDDVENQPIKLWSFYLNQILSTPTRV